MTTEKMNVHKALSELKILDVRIATAIQDSTFCIGNKHSNEKINGVTVDEFKKEIQAGYDKITDLTKRRNAIKRAVVLSNAVTKVTVAGEEYTVAEAIEMKNHGLDYDRQLLQDMKREHAKCVLEINAKNGSDLERRLEAYITSLYGDKETKTDLEKVKKAEAEFVKQNTYELIDPLDIQKKIEELEERISNFMSDVDSALSSSNAITEIEVSY